MPDWLWIQNVVFPILGMGMGTFAMFGIYRTVNRHLDRKHEKEMVDRGGGSGRQMEELRARVEELEENAMRVHELEERLDFAERMIARQDHRRLDGTKAND